MGRCHAGEIAECDQNPLADGGEGVVEGEGLLVPLCLYGVGVAKFEG